MSDVFFVDLKGSILEDFNINSHIELAKNLINNNEELHNKFIESGYDKEDLFLVEYIGYALGSRESNNQYILINKEKTTRGQKATLFKFITKGYKCCFTDEKNN